MNILIKKFKDLVDLVVSTITNEVNSLKDQVNAIEGYDTYKASINELLTTLNTSITNLGNYEDIKVLADINTYKNEVNTIKDTAVTALKDITDNMLKDIKDAAKDKIDEIYNKYKDYITDNDVAADILKTVNDAKATIDNKDNFTNIVEDFKTLHSTLENKAITYLVNTVKTAVANATSLIEDQIDVLDKKIKSVDGYDTYKASISEVLTTLKTSINNLGNVDDLKELTDINTYKTELATLKDTAVNALKEIAANILSDVKASAIKKVNDTYNEVVTDLEDDAKAVIDPLKDDALDAIDKATEIADIQKEANDFVDAVKAAAKPFLKAVLKGKLDKAVENGTTLVVDETALETLNAKLEGYKGEIDSTDTYKDIGTVFTTNLGLLEVDIKKAQLAQVSVYYEAFCAEINELAETYKKQCTAIEFGKKTKITAKATAVKLTAETYLDLETILEKLATLKTETETYFASVVAGTDKTED